MSKEFKYIEIEVDKIVNSIENIVTGEVFKTQIFNINLTDLKKMRESDWQFDWKLEFSDKSKEVFKLTTIDNPTIIQGLLSIEDKDDHIFMHLLESANFNIGKLKVYLGIPANLIAFACKISFEKGYSGFIAFDAKTQLIDHYKKTIGAKHFQNQRMYIDTKQAYKLVENYFKR